MGKQQSGSAAGNSTPDGPERARLIAGSAPFVYMTDDAVRAFADAGRIVDFAPGDAIFHEHEEATSVIVVLEGLAYVCSYQPEGREVIEAVIAPVDSFGWFGLVDPAQRSTSAVFRGSGRLLLIPKREMNLILDAFPGAWRAVARFLAVRLRRTLASQRALAGFPLDRRVAFVLCQNFRVEIPGNTSISELQLSQEDVASLTGTSRQSANRLLRRWEEQGILRIQYGRLALLDPKALQDIALAREP